MRKLTTSICAILVLSTLLFVVFGAGTASAKSVNTIHPSAVAVSQHVNLSLNIQQATQQVLKLSGTTNPKMVQPHVSFQCQIVNLKGHTGTLCILLYEQCYGPFCVLYAVDINFNQALIDRLALTGAAGAAALGAIISGWIPQVNPYVTVVVSVLTYVAISLDNYARSSCGGQGVGIYIGFPSGYYYHC